MEIDLSKLRAAAIRHTVEEGTAWLRQVCKGDPLDMEVRRRIIELLSMSIYLYNEKAMMYDSVKDGRLGSYIEAIDTLAELENLQHIPEGTKNRRSNI